MYMYSYDYHSESGWALAKALGLKMIKHVDSKFKGNPDTKVLNWGCSDLPVQVRRCQVYNNENHVYNAINKRIALSTFRSEGIPTVPFTSDIREAKVWLNEGSRVFARTKTMGKDGEGLVEVTTETIDATDCRLWTKFIPCEKEYRINIVREYPDSAVACQRKVPLDGFTGTLNPAIKTTSNGYGFKFVTRNIPDEVIEVADDALLTLGLDFGGVDVLWDGDDAYVLEVNTAPHLTPRTIETLLPAFKRLMGINE